jgi:hypothetical protein
MNASTAAGPLEVESAASLPHGYSSSARDPGIVIRPGPGDSVRLDFTVSRPADWPAGEIVVQPEWDYMKDRLVGVLFSLDVRPHIRVAAVLGVLVLTVVAFIRD